MMGGVTDLLCPVIRCVLGEFSVYFIKPQQKRIAWLGHQKLSKCFFSQHNNFVL